MRRIYSAEWKLLQDTEIDEAYGEYIKQRGTPKMKMKSYDENGIAIIDEGKLDDYIELTYNGILRVTEKAILLEMENLDGHFVEQWLPKAVCRNVADGIIYVWDKFANDNLGDFA